MHKKSEVYKRAYNVSFQLSQGIGSSKKGDNSRNIIVRARRKVMEESRTVHLQFEGINKYRYLAWLCEHCQSINTSFTRELKREIEDF